MEYELSEQFMMLTPGGHELLVELDYPKITVSRANLVHQHTGAMRPLGREISETLSRAFKAKQVYERALREVTAIESRHGGLDDTRRALGAGHPGLKSLQNEAAYHRAIIEDMRARAYYFYEAAMRAVDKAAEH